MGRRLRDPALRHGITGPPLGAEELLTLRAHIGAELVAIATARSVDLNELRRLGRTARLVDRRLELLAEREREAPTVQRRQAIAAARDAQLTARR